MGLNVCGLDRNTIDILSPLAKVMCEESVQPNVYSYRIRIINLISKKFCPLSGLDNSWCPGQTFGHILIRIWSGDPFTQDATSAPKTTKNWDSIDLSQEVPGLSALCQ